MCDKMAIPAYILKIVEKDQFTTLLPTGGGGGGAFWPTPSDCQP